MARRDKKPRIKIMVPTGPEMVRMYHRNIVANDRNLHTPRIEVPSVVTRAKMVVRESREIAVRFAQDT